MILLSLKLGASRTTKNLAKMFGMYCLLSQRSRKKVDMFAMEIIRVFAIIAVFLSTFATGYILYRVFRS